MPGPFPGMDPFLENHWGDIHTTITAYARKQLQPQLPPGLRARVEEYIAVELEDEWRPRRPDVRVVEEPTFSRTSAATAVLPEISEELIVELDSDPRIERVVHVIDQTSGERVVTSIEFLSPWNKESNEGRERFRQKQKEILVGGVNLVEIDLLRAGGWAVSIPEWVLPASYHYPYRICVRRASDLRRAVYYPTRLQARLPVIRIPLRPADGDVRLDLQKLIDEAWEDGGYFGLAHLRGPLPPFNPTDEDWIREQVRSVSQQPQTSPGT